MAAECQCPARRSFGLRRGRAAGQGVAVLLWFGSSELSFESHGFEFWCLCCLCADFLAHAAHKGQKSGKASAFDGVLAFAAREVQWRCAIQLP